MNKEFYASHDEEDTIRLGFDFAKILKAGDIVAFYGDLGSGKTEFIKGICDYFEVNEIVTSPTFTIFNHYTGVKDDEEIIIYHIDLYRIQKNEELLEIGLTDCLFSGKTIKLIEWAEKAGDLIPNSHYHIEILTSTEIENDREVVISKNEVLETIPV